jgi:hypothetical protein
LHWSSSRGLAGNDGSEGFVEYDASEGAEGMLLGRNLMFVGNVGSCPWKFVSTIDGMSLCLGLQVPSYTTSVVIVAHFGAGCFVYWER